MVAEYEQILSALVFDAKLRGPKIVVRVTHRLEWTAAQRKWRYELCLNHMRAGHVVHSRSNIRE